MTGIRNCVKQLEKLSLITCSNDVLILLERALGNVEPILKINGHNVKPLLWQNNLSLDRIHNDIPKARLNTKDLERNTSRFFEDYVSVGIEPGKRVN